MREKIMELCDMTAAARLFGGGSQHEAEGSWEAVGEEDEGHKYDMKVP